MEPFALVKIEASIARERANEEQRKLLELMARLDMQRARELAGKYNFAPQVRLFSRTCIV